MTIKAVTFDVGSTLLFPQPSVAEVFQREAKKYGYKIELDAALRGTARCFELYQREYAKNGDFWCSDDGCRWIWQTQYELLCEMCGVGEHTADVVRDMYAAFDTADNWGVYDDVLPCLDALRAAGVRLGIVSNWSSSLHGILAGLGLGEFFDVVLPSGETGLRKPDVRFFEAARAALGLQGAEILHVGDLDPEDGLAPLAAGMQACVIDRHVPARPHDARLTVIKDLRDVVALAQA